MNMNYLFMYLYHFLFLLSEFCIFHIQILLFILLRSHLGFPGGSAGKESACNAGDLGSIPGWGRSPGERTVYPLWYSGLDDSMVWRSPWSFKELDMTE